MIKLLGEQIFGKKFGYVSSLFIDNHQKKRYLDKSYSLFVYLLVILV